MRDRESGSAHTQERIQRKIKAGMEALGSAMDEGRQKWFETGRDLEKRIKASPALGIACAFGAGYLFGKLFKRR